ncbi:MAG: hypothetical protein QM802_04970 [Agriterribacter sp.]
MKTRIIYLIIIVLNLTLAQFAQSQIKQGTVMLGSTVSFHSSRSNGPYDFTNKNVFYSIDPSLGRVVRQNLILGIDLLYSNRRIDEIINGIINYTKVNTFGLGATASPYQNLGKSGIYLFLYNRLGFDYSRTKNTRLTGGYDLNGNTFTFGLGVSPGVSYAVNKKFHVEAGLSQLFWIGYSNSQFKYDGPDQLVSKSSKFNANIGLGNSILWSVGFKFFFPPSLKS